MKPLSRTQEKTLCLMVNDMDRLEEIRKSREALEKINEKLERIAECLEYFLEEMDEKTKRGFSPGPHF